MDGNFILLKKYRMELAIFIGALLFSAWLMFSTFYYQQGMLVIATKVWSDFATHIPLIRSFSLGHNFPPEYPLFPGMPIQYHFIFYAVVGMLEKMGVRIDYALNILSIIGLACLITMIYVFSKALFRSTAVSLLSVLFFLFNGSLNFIYYFIQYPFPKYSLSTIFANDQFISFGPFDGKIISAFWNLNIYTNQRHLAISYALSLLLIYIIFKSYLSHKAASKKNSLLVGIVLGLSFLLNMAVFLMTGIIFFILFLMLKQERWHILLTLIIAGLLAFPQYLYIRSGHLGPPITFYPGYLIDPPVTLFKFCYYWLQNIGLHLFLIPLGFCVAPNKAKIFFMPFFTLFVAANLFKFAPALHDNHKFFNYFLLIGSMFSAYFLYYLWNINLFSRLCAVSLVPFLIFSGVIDFFPILNDGKITISDYAKNPNILWIMQYTKPQAVFLNTRYLYDDASLAGRKIFLGLPTFAWSYGYDTDKRHLLWTAMLAEPDKNILCEKLKMNGINYIELSASHDVDLDKIQTSAVFEKEFKPVYISAKRDYKLFAVEENC